MAKQPKVKEKEEKQLARPGVQPDYVGDGVAIWKRTDRYGGTYLRVKILGGLFVNCFERKKPGNP